MTDQLQMNSDLPYPGYHIDIELIEILLLNQERLYPWNPLNSQAERYFSEIENSMGNHTPDLVDYLDEGCSQFYQSLDRLWESANPVLARGLKSRLEAKFSQMVPQEVLAAIASKAEQLTASSSSIADQLIHCVQESLPQWDIDDLFVLARPFAYAMRGGEERNALDRVVQRASTLDWESSSELEKARLTLAVARYAIACRDRDEFSQLPI